jgi:23S rRNA pseudouridine2605 synthase
LTLEQLEAARAERMRQNGNGALTLDDTRTWMEETGLCLFLPKRQFSTSLAPSFVEAVAGQRNGTPDPRQIAAAEELLVRLELEGVVVRLNLLGQPGEQPDYVVAAWVLPYVYALRGDRDWRRTPQLTGSRQVSQLAIQAYKHLETGDQTIAELKQALGQGVSETAVLRAITELWQQLRIIPVVAAPGKAAKWQLLRHRFQKAIAEGASTSQVTAISVLASIFLQAVIAASMEEVEVFLSPLTARSKIREVIRGLVATRQVHTLSMGHAPHFYVAGTLPEFATPSTVYSSSIGASYFSPAHEDHAHEEEVVPEPAPLELAAAEVPSTPAPETHAHANGVRRAAGNGKAAAPRPHFTRPAARDRKPAQSGSNSRPVRRSSESRTGAARPASSRPVATSGRSAGSARWAGGATKSAHGASPVRNGNGNGNGNHAASGSKAALSGGNGRTSHASEGSRNGNGTRAANGTRPANSARSTNGARPAKAGSGASWSNHSGSRPAAAKAGPAARSGTLSRSSAAPRKDGRTEARGSRGDRKPALTAGGASRGTKRFGYAAKQGTKKRG